MSDKEPVFHPCPGSMPHGAWMNVLLEDEGEGTAGYDKPVPLILQQFDLHNLIVLLMGAAKRAPSDHSRSIHLNLAEKLDIAWKQSLSSSTPDGGHRNARR